MRKLRLLALVVMIAAAHIGEAFAYDSGWVRLTPDELFDYQIAKDKFRINNFNLVEEKSFSAKGLTVLKLSLSAANRRDKAVQFSVQFIGLDGQGNVLFAVTAEPSFSQVSGGRTKDVNGDIYIPPGESAKASAYLVRVVGTL